jgi:hypothetical protein
MQANTALEMRTADPSTNAAPDKNFSIVGIRPSKNHDRAMTKLHARLTRACKAQGTLVRAIRELRIEIVSGSYPSEVPDRCQHLPAG